MKKVLIFIIVFAIGISLSSCAFADLNSPDTTTTVSSSENDSVTGESPSSTPSPSENDAETTPSTSSSPSESEEATIDVSLYYDYDCLHRPTMEDVQKITKGMKMSEVIEILGKPHRTLPTAYEYIEGWMIEGIEDKILWVRSYRKQYRPEYGEVDFIEWERENAEVFSFGLSSEF